MAVTESYQYTTDIRTSVQNGRVLVWSMIPAPPTREDYRDRRLTANVAAYSGS